jgi:hypothetical protein
MTMHDHSQYEPHRRREEAAPRSFWSSRTFFVSLVFLGMVVALLFTEHRAHVLGFLPFLFVLACPLLHFTMHGGHGSHGGNGSREGDSRGDRS